VIFGDYLVMTLTLLNLFSAIAYGIAGDYPRVFYWLGAFILTGSTLFLRR